MQDLLPKHSSYSSGRPLLVLIVGVVVVLPPRSTVLIDSPLHRIPPSVADAILRTGRRCRCVHVVTMALAWLPCRGGACAARTQIARYTILPGITWKRTTDVCYVSLGVV